MALIASVRLKTLQRLMQNCKQQKVIDILFGSSNTSQLRPTEFLPTPAVAQRLKPPHISIIQVKCIRIRAVYQAKSTNIGNVEATFVVMRFSYLNFVSGARQPGYGAVYNLYNQGQAMVLGDGIFTGTNFKT